MSIVKFDPATLLSALPAGAAVAEPIGEPVSQVAVKSFASERCATSRTGVWACTPGRWRRQIQQAEFCVFLEGDALFEPDHGEPVEIRAGEAVYFPAGSLGVWTIRQTARKAYVIFDEPQ
ncbi:cupin domain-containing protein [uncultured Caulobacter sp.]|jgi:uncharacterized protein|uniref:cupin domain-containing protein n=1 Tax=uncultured Caulobacter sp. TaxID=158749 RepID=UPI002613DB4D|nr:cupin domain-containing protein [uncultured Caulobacter sp.]